jgi:flagellar basal body-associated protein FliL
MLKNQNGITLVALVITIIVLLILAGITISLTIGQGGILTTAQKAGQNYQDAAANERNDLNDMFNLANNIIYNVTD